MFRAQEKNAVITWHLHMKMVEFQSRSTDLRIECLFKGESCCQINLHMHTTQSSTRRQKNLIEARDAN
jgi:hypothetical protein